MRRNVWLVLVLVLIVPVMMTTVSCAKKAVGSQGDAVQAAPVDQNAVDAAEKARLQGERLRAEAEAAAKSAFTNEDVYFEFDSSAINPDAKIILGTKGSYMRANTGINIMVEGHCDERGTDAYNMALGERRAEAAKAFLVNSGIDAKKIATISYGEEKPMDTGKGEAAWAKNRRAHFTIK